jgi:hypothetical protein
VGYHLTGGLSANYLVELMAVTKLWTFTSGAILAASPCLWHVTLSRIVLHFYTVLLITLRPMMDGFAGFFNIMYNTVSVPTFTS